MFNIENPGRGLQQPPFGGRVTENASGGGGIYDFSEYVKFGAIS